MKDFWGIKKKKRKKKKINLIEYIKDIKNDVVKRKINKKKKKIRKINIKNKYNVMERDKWCYQEKKVK